MLTHHTLSSFRSWISVILWILSSTSCAKKLEIFSASSLRVSGEGISQVRSASWFKPLSTFLKVSIIFFFRSSILSFNCFARSSVRPSGNLALLILCLLESPLGKSSNFFSNCWWSSSKAKLIFEQFSLKIYYNFSYCSRILPTYSYKSNKWGSSDRLPFDMAAILRRSLV